MLPESKYRLGLVQMTCSTDPAENLEKALLKIQEAARMGAQVVCLQELFRSQYFCRVESAELFDLGHEYGHIIRGHVSSVSLVRRMIF